MNTATLDFAPITLEELNMQAALMRRTDRKYPLHREAADAAVATLHSGIKILTIDGRTQFSYDSIYFDTTAFDSYLGAARARSRRFKVRTRHYVDSGEAFLEVKTLEGGQTVKRRIPHDPTKLFDISGEGQEFVRECLELGGITGIEPAWLRPTLMTSYARTTLLAADGQSRITIDDDLRWRGVGSTEISTAGLVIIETKSPGQSSAVDRHLWSLGNRPGRISKYATGLAALKPQLPANRWHRTLNTHFAH